jgi:GNAT superfamily N-acetyltransferase
MARQRENVLVIHPSHTGIPGGVGEALHKVAAQEPDVRFGWRKRDEHEAVIHASIPDADERAGIGHMTWHAGPAKPERVRTNRYGEEVRDPAVGQGEIDELHVDSAYRRQGIASAMWHVSRQLLPYVAPEHSPHRTKKGDAWARAVGGPLPKQQEAAWNPLRDD